MLLNLWYLISHRCNMLERCLLKNQWYLNCTHHFGICREAPFNRNTEKECVMASKDDSFHNWSPRVQVKDDFTILKFNNNSFLFTAYFKRTCTDGSRNLTSAFVAVISHLIFYTFLTNYNQITFLADNNRYIFYFKLFTLQTELILKQKMFKV